MKKQIIAAAVAASMSAVALADVSITGATKVNWTSTDGSSGVENEISTEMDLNVVGKVGDTAVHMNFESTESSNLETKNSYLTTNVGGVAVKAGTWYTGDSNLNNAGEQNERVSLTSDMGPLSVNFQHEAGAASGDHNEVTVKAAIGGINVSYEIENTDDHKILGLSGDISGVKFAYTDSDSDATSGADEESGYSLTTDIAGMTVTYQHMESTKGTTSDGFFGTWAGTSGAAAGAADAAKLKEASGFGITTSLAGNTAHVRNYENKTSSAQDGSVDSTKRDTKVIVTRKLASGATAEVTYRTGDSANQLDVELTVAF